MRDPLGRVPPLDESRSLPLDLAWRALDAAPDGITITDAAGTILYVNPAFTRITGYARADAIGRNPRILKSGQHGPEFYAALWNALTTAGEWRGQIWNRRKSGEIFPERISIMAIRDHQGQAMNYAAIFADDSSFQGLRAELEHMAFHDPLTGVPNRRLLRDRCEQALARAARRGEGTVALLYLDLDGFKPINDRLGHEAGDEALREVARRLVATVRRTDTVARMGGDEFAILMDELGDGAPDSALARERIEEALTEPFEIRGSTVRLAATIGVVLAEPDERFEDLLARADRAMYAEKAARPTNR